MKVFSTLNLEDGSVQNLNLSEQDQFPNRPKVGSCIMKDKRLMLCVTMGDLPVWIPITQEMGMHTHTQPTEASRWEVSHGLNVGRPIVQAYDETGEVVIPSTIRAVDANNVEIIFPAPVAGSAVVIAGTSDGLPHQDIAFDRTFNTPELVWTVNHSLGYVPGVRVYVNNYEVQPKDIEHVGTSQTIITFSTPQAGRVVCI